VVAAISAPSIFGNSLGTGSTTGGGAGVRD